MRRWRAIAASGLAVVAVLNRLLRERSGYELELINRSNDTSMDRTERFDGVDLATANSAVDDLLAEDVYAIAAREPLQLCTQAAARRLGGLPKVRSRSLACGS